MTLAGNRQNLLLQVERDKEVTLQEIATCNTKLVTLKQQLADLEAFLRIYRSLDSSRDVGGKTTHDAVPRRQRSNKASTIEAAVDKLLSESKVLPTRDIVQYLNDMGIEVGGKNQELNLAPILSKSPRFIYSRAAGGWMLVPPCPVITHSPT